MIRDAIVWGCLSFGLVSIVTGLYFDSLLLFTTAVPALFGAIAADRKL